MLSLSLPADVNGDQLAAELEAAGLTKAEVAVVGDTLEVEGVGLTEEAVAQIVSAHKPKVPVPPTTTEKLAALGFTVNELKKVLA